MGKEDRHAIGVIRDAFVALEGSHPELIPKISAALKSSGGKDLSGVEVVFREAAVALVPTDRDAAETLFTFAEILAQTLRKAQLKPLRESSH